ncbi:MAG: BLUF domain-containing protein [Janthinobacterium lividum]
MLATARYSYSGHFMQLLEGPAQEIQALFAKIHQDSRHAHVQIINYYEATVRWFADWRMAHVNADEQDYYWLLGYFEAKGHNLVQTQISIASPHLRYLTTAV